MPPRFQPRVTYANVVATLALFLALGGGTYAAFKLPNNSVGTKQLKKNAVTSPKVKDGSLTAADLAGGQFLRPGQKAANADRLDGIDSTGFVRHGDAAGGALAGNYPAPTLADGVVGPKQASFTGFARLNSDVSVTSGFAKALDVTVQVPRQHMLIAVYAHGELKTSNSAHAATVTLNEQSGAGGAEIGQVFSTTSTTGAQKQTSPGSTFGATGPNTVGGGWITVPTGFITGPWHLQLLIHSNSTATSTLFQAAELYATVLP